MNKGLRLRAFALFVVPLLLCGEARGATNEQLAPRSIGPAGMSGRITAIDVNPRDKNIWYIGSASGGLWRTTNAGITFTPLFDQQPVQSIGAVAVAPSNPSIVYVGTGEGNPRNSQSSGNGIYKSYDGGQTWRHLGLEASRNIHRLIVHPHNDQIIWAGVLGDPFADSTSRGLYKSVDGGRNWTQVLATNARSGIADLVMDPENPNKLLAALWDFRRRPWDFTSGGPGSGLHMTQDGGETWVELTTDAGLPAKPYGRIGLAIAPSRVETVYALIESEETGLYRSQDGGLSWTLINRDTIGSRPFYFADIYVDPSNENRVYNLYSRLARSEDGGREFKVIEDWGYEVHADHHAFWIDPDDPDFIIDGTDGGLYWSRDRGENWRFAENLPLGQFYHLTLDDAIPYRVYGGLQDNGTWYGPSETWNRGGLRNSYWRELAFNDGFDVLLHRSDSDTLYALWQSGMLLRVNTRTGQRKTITPASDDTALRFNWNAAIAADPFDADTIYIGSQFVHRSLNRGDSWTAISPDLTTNNPQRQRQSQSGGLSIDATGAENHTSITAIEPSQLQEGVIWVGSDDGKLHLSRDGGDHWEDLSETLAGVAPDGSLRQIVASRYRAQEVFVVIDNHLQGDWTPYLLHSTDYGQSWTNLLQGEAIPAYALSFVQDAKEPRLLFAGTEFGLYYSLDAGTSWTKWTRGFPSVATTDMKIQPREADLVLATFGRSLWVLDDLQPWRALAAAPDLRQSALHLFAPPVTYQPVIAQAPAHRLSPDNVYAGDNNARQALISFWVGDPAIESVDISISSAGKPIRRWTEAASPGLNRIHWDLQWEGKAVYGPLMSPVLERALAPPGNYTVSIAAAGQVHEAKLTLLADPRVDFDDATYRENLNYRLAIESLQAQLDDVKAGLSCMEQQLEEQGSDTATSRAEPLRDAMDAVWQQIEFRDIQGVVSDSDRLTHRLAKAYYYTHSPYEALTENDRTLLASLRLQTSALLADFASLKSGPWKVMADALEENARAPADCN